MLVHAGVLQVYLLYNTGNSTLLQLTNPDGKDKTLNWKTTEQDITSTVLFAIAFDAQQPLAGSVTVVIDDVQLLEGICSAQTTAPPPTLPTRPRMYCFNLD